MASAPLALVHLVKRSGNTIAVDKIDLKIAAGSCRCLLGPSGCGKTSTLHMITGHEIASEGDILLGPRNITCQPAGGRARHRDAVPESRAVSAPVGTGQRGLRPEDARHGQAAAPGQGGRSAGAGEFVARFMGRHNGIPAVVIQSMWSPAVTAVRSKRIACNLQPLKEGDRACAAGSGLPATLRGKKLDGAGAGARALALAFDRQRQRQLSWTTPAAPATAAR